MYLAKKEAMGNKIVVMSMYDANQLNSVYFSVPALGGINKFRG